MGHGSVAGSYHRKASPQKTLPMSMDLRASSVKYYTIEVAIPAYDLLGLGRDEWDVSIHPVITFDDLWFKLGIRQRAVLRDNGDRVCIRSVASDRQPNETPKLTFRIPERGFGDDYEMEGIARSLLRDWTSMTWFYAQEHIRRLSGASPARFATYIRVCAVFFNLRDAAELSDCTVTEVLRPKKRKGTASGSLLAALGLTLRSSPPAGVQGDSNLRVRPVRSHAARAQWYEEPDPELRQRIHSLPPEIFDLIKEALLQDAFGPRRFNLKCGPFHHQGISLALNKDLYQKCRHKLYSESTWVVGLCEGQCDRAAVVRGASFPHRNFKFVKKWELQLSTDDIFNSHPTYSEEWFQPPRLHGRWAICTNSLVALHAYQNYHEFINFQLLEMWAKTWAFVTSSQATHLHLDLSRAFGADGVYMGDAVMLYAQNSPWNSRLGAKESRTITIRAPCSILEDDMRKFFNR